jgi:hypothetical protein
VEVEAEEEEEEEEAAGMETPAAACRSKNPNHPRRSPQG